VLVAHEAEQYPAICPVSLAGESQRTIELDANAIDFAEKSVLGELQKESIGGPHGPNRV
jgi:hypothetical protein